MDDMLARIEELERRLNDALGQAEQHHPEILAKEIAALRGKTEAMREFEQELDLRLRHMQTLVAGLRATGLN